MERYPSDIAAAHEHETNLRHAVHMELLSRFATSGLSEGEDYSGVVADLAALVLTTSRRLGDSPYFSALEAFSFSKLTRVLCDRLDRIDDDITAGSMAEDIALRATFDVERFLNTIGRWGEA